jgi:hypothetical protein
VDAIMKMLKMLGPDDTIAEIKRLYFKTTRNTITADFARAIDLVKTLPTEEDRERVTVYMEGLAQMRKDWARQDKRRAPRKR